MNQNKKLIFNINRYIIILLSIIVFSSIIFMINKGYDFSDEGALLLGYDNIQEYKGGVLNHHLIFHYFFGYFAYNVFLIRVFNFIFFFFISVFFANEIKKYIYSKWGNDSQLSNSSIFCLVFISVYIYYFLGFHTFSYNSFVHVFLIFFVGVILRLVLEINLTEKVSLRSHFLVFILGFVMGICFFIKFSSSLLFLTFTLLYFILSFFSIKKFFLFFKLLFLVFLGLLISFIFFFTEIQQYVTWKVNFKNEMNFLTTHRPYELLLLYFFQLKHLFLFNLKYFSWIILIVYFLKYFRKKMRFFYVLFSLFFLIFELIYFKFYQSTFAVRPWYNAYLYILIIFYFVLHIFIKKKIWNSFKSSLKNFDLYILILFIIAPFLASLGTANPIFLNCLWHGTTWILLSFFFFYNSYLKTSKYYYLIGFFVVLFFTSSQIIDGNLIHPYFTLSYNYGKASTGFEQKFEIHNNSKLKGILVDKETKEVIEGLSDIYHKNHFGPKTPTIGFFIPGLIYAVDGVSPYTYYYYNLPRDSIAITNSIINNKLVMLVTDQTPVSNAVKNALKTKKIDYPNDFQLIDSVLYPRFATYLKVLVLSKK
jgi:hypothetical protein